MYTPYSYSFEILCGIVLYIFRFKINTLLCYTVVLVLGIGIARGQYYWILGALFGKHCPGYYYYYKQVGVSTWYFGLYPANCTMPRGLHTADYDAGNYHTNRTIIENSVSFVRIYLARRRCREFERICPHVK